VIAASDARLRRLFRQLPLKSHPHQFLSLHQHQYQCRKQFLLLRMFRLLRLRLFRQRKRLPSPSWSAHRKALPIQAQHKICTFNFPAVLFE
jgi:hypothetical protein